MELGDGNFPAPYPPPPAEPIRVFCPQRDEELRRAWKSASQMSNVEWHEKDGSKCKLMIFQCVQPEKVSAELWAYMTCFFQRDGRESLVYEYRPLHGRFFEWDHDIFRREPWRVVNA